jgi:hypothetical protein
MLERKRKQPEEEPLAKRAPLHFGYDPFSLLITVFLVLAGMLDSDGRAPPNWRQNSCEPKQLLEVTKSPLLGCQSETPREEVSDGKEHKAPGKNTDCQRDHREGTCPN